MREETSDLKDSETREKIGTAFKSDTRVNVCICGETVVQQVYRRTDKGNEVFIVIGFCNCGNVFITQAPTINREIRYLKVKSLQT